MEAALDLLAGGGVAAVLVEALAEKLGVTKGAFYPRYTNRAQLLEEMLDYWRVESTISVINHFEAHIRDPIDRLDRILTLSTRRRDVGERARIEIAIRLWSHSEPKADATMREIDNLRMRYFKMAMIETGLPDAEAEARAFLVYAYMIADGSLPGTRPDSLRELCRNLLRRDTMDRSQLAPAEE